MKLRFVSIDYDEGVDNSYRAVTISCDNEVVKFDTGNPVKDWNDAMEYVSGYSYVIYTSSCDHFVFDNSYHYDENDNLVPDGE
jgi:hypothetical protein